MDSNNNSSMNLDAVIQEFVAQRNVLGDRAAQLAGFLAAANAQIEGLKKRITELEKKPDETR